MKGSGVMREETRAMILKLKAIKKNEKEKVDDETKAMARKLASMKHKIMYLIQIYCPQDTQFYWHNGKRNSIGICKCKYCKKYREFYDYEIAISLEYAIEHSWEEVRRFVIQEIAHSRSIGKEKEVFYDEYNRLIKIIEKPKKEKAKAA